MTGPQSIAMVAGALTLWSRSETYNTASHQLHRIAMVVGGTLIYALGLKMGARK